MTPSVRIKGSQLRHHQTVLYMMFFVLLLIANIEFRPVTAGAIPWPVTPSHILHHASFDMSHEQIEIFEHIPENDGVTQYEYCKRHVGAMDLSATWMFQPGKNETRRHTLMEIYKWCLHNRKRLLQSRDRYGEGSYNHLHHEFGGIHYPTVTARGLAGTNFVVPAYDYVVSNRIKILGTYEPSEFAVMHTYIKPGTMALDIGANTGAYTPYMGMFVGESGAVFAFEPFKNLFQIMTANVALNGLQNVWTFNMGLGAYTARQHAKAPSFNDFTNTGMMRIFDQLPEHSTSSNALLYDGTESIQVTTLDRHLNETAHLLRATGKENIRIGFVKIDVEDQAEMVLLGARKMLREHRPVVLLEWDYPPRILMELGYDCRVDSWALKQHDLLLCVPRNVSRRSHRFAKRQEAAQSDDRQGK